MSIKETLVTDMKVAMRGKETVRLETIRLLRAAIQRKEVDDRVQLDDEGVLQIIQKMVKQCTDAAQQFSNGNREDLADKEKANISILETYLPEQLSEQELEILIQEAIQQTGAESMKDMGKVMGIVNKELAGQADGKTISTIVKAKLS